MSTGDLMQIDLHSNYDDRDQSVSQLVSDLEPIHNLMDSTQWVLDCHQSEYLGPFAAVLIAAAYLVGVELGQRPRVLLPESPAKLAAFCELSGLKSLFSGSAPPDRNHPDSETVPLTRFTEARWDHADETVRLIGRHIEIDDDLEDYVRTSIYEVVQNVVDHACSPVGGILCARYIASNHELRVAVPDRGRGILDSLQERHPDVKNSFGALTKVIAGGHSAMSRPNNMGLGISNLWLLMQELNGRIALVSGNAWARIIPGTDNKRLETLHAAFPGTAVFFTIPTRT